MRIERIAEQEPASPTGAGKKRDHAAFAGWSKSREETPMEGSGSEEATAFPVLQIVTPRALTNLNLLVTLITEYLVQEACRAEALA
jgi:hypothetical protein